MPYRRGTIVLVYFPEAGQQTAKKRPAVVIQADGLDTGLPQCLLAQITSNLARMGPSRVMVRQSSPDGKAMGLLSDSVVVTDHIATVEYAAIHRTLGACLDMTKIDSALRAALAL